MQDQDESTEFNVRATGYFLARASGRCRACRREIILVAVGLPPGHERRECDDDAQDDSNPWSAWNPCEVSALLFFVGRLPASVVRRCREHSAAFKRADDPAAGSYWANHCPNCGALASDQELFCEPEGAFLPMDRPPHGVRLAFVDEPVEAAAGGYVSDPGFLAHALAR